MIKVIQNPNILRVRYDNDPIRNFNGILFSIFPEINLAPENVPVGDVPYEILEWKIGKAELRLLQNKSGHVLTLRLDTGLLWVISESETEKIPTLTEEDLINFNWYLNESAKEYQLEVTDDPTIFKFEADSGDIYDINTKEVTCSCRDFKHRRSHYSIDKVERHCKHLQAVFLTYPELLPQSIREADNDHPAPIESDGKVRYPRAVFDMYVSDLKAVLSQFPNMIERFEICGSYRRLAPMVSDLDLLIVLKEGQSWDALLDYCENILGYKLIENIGRGEKKAAYMIDGFIHVDFKNIPLESWPFALCHFTGSKATNIEMRRQANRMGLKLNEYELVNESTGEAIQGLNTEQDIYEYLQLPYKQPWER